MREKPFAGEVWETLSKIDCSAHVEQKQGLTYLSWAWAWGTLMEYYPETEYEFLESEIFPDGTMNIWILVTVVDGGRATTRKMWLPVLATNKPIQNPNAFQINTTRMRCLTKCLAMFGLGHYIYAGEDLPPAEDTFDQITEGHADELKMLIEQTNADVKRFLAAFGAPSVDQMHEGSYEKAKSKLILKLKKQEASNE